MSTTWTCSYKTLINLTAEKKMVVVYFPALKFFKTGSPEQPLRNPKTFSSILKTSQEFLTNSQGGERDSYQTDSYQNDNQT